MEIRNTRVEDIKRVLEIYEKAKIFMKDNGNSTQWINGYPSKELIESDIQNIKSYVCLDDTEIVGIFYFAIGIEKTYHKIYEGQWLNNQEYGVIHRIAVDGKQKGIASFCINWCYEQIKNIRIDTHRNNKPMQKLLEKNGFKYCGIIYFENGDERIAYQKG
jgi:RimJ/RimL family protein N-acetyltransferase